MTREGKTSQGKDVKQLCDMSRTLSLSLSLSCQPGLKKSLVPFLHTHIATHVHIGAGKKKKTSLHGNEHQRTDIGGGFFFQQKRWQDSLALFLSFFAVFFSLRGTCSFKKYPSVRCQKNEKGMKMENPIHEAQGKDHLKKHLICLFEESVVSELVSAFVSQIDTNFSISKESSYGAS